MSEHSERYDLIIIGAGPAGLSAAIYAARGSLSTLVIDQSSAGGQVKTTHQVANYPGFAEAVPGYELARAMRNQAEHFGARFELAVEIEDLDLNGDEKWVRADGVVYHARNVILASGSSPRLLNVPGEQEFKGAGISYCATCDGDFYTDKDVVVVGGGNSAMEESLLLLQYVKSITVIHQFDQLQAEKITADKILANPKVKVLWSHEPRQFEKVGDKIVVTAENLKTKEREQIERDGAFIFIGMVPNSDFLKKTALKFSDSGYLETDELMQTNLAGVYAAGDLRVKKFRQITTAVSDGTIAAMQIIQTQ
ncbi:MAG: thioredoxin reductase [Chloroflexota bacterium]|nr:thioredoxin reductase [Chloroflexota bacterium]